MNEIQLRPSDSYALADGGVSPLDAYSGNGHEQAPEHAETLFHKVHRLLHGRYHWCFLIGGVIGGALGAYLYKTTRPVWMSTASIQIKAFVIPVIGEQQTDQTPFDQLRETQISLLKSQRLAEHAMDTKTWKGLGRGPVTIEKVTEFMEQLSVTTQGKSEIVTIGFTDFDPKAAHTGVRAAMEVYRNLYMVGTGDEDDARRRRERLQLELKSLENEERGLRQSVQDIAMAFYGTDDLQPVMQARLDAISRYEYALDAEKFALATYDNPQLQAPRPATRPAEKVEEMTAAAIAARGDEKMRQLLEERSRSESNLEYMMGRGAGPKHDVVMREQHNLAVTNKAIEQRREQWIAEARANPAGVPNDLGTGRGVRSREQIEQQIRTLEKFLEMAKAEGRRVGEKAIQLETIKRTLREKQDQLGVVRHRLRNEDLEGDQPRVRIISDGEQPRVWKDSRKTYAAAGGLGGLGAGFALVLLVSLFDRRFRTPDDARTTGKMALLGVLPNLPDDLTDPEQAALAAHCVHQIRTLLQIGGAGAERRVFVVTSPAAGTGKTSLSLSLGVSFAATQSRTLLIDCDLIGGGLTVRVDAVIRRKIGQILKREGLINEAQLEEALKIARSSPRKLGEILVSLQYAKQEDIAWALGVQAEKPVGILDAIAGDDLMDCVAQTAIAGLHILPLGAAMPTEVSKLSPAGIRSLLEQARQHFDTVVIDTGPIPGSLEASLASAAADAVVMVVSRGEHRPLVERAMQHLRDIGAPLAGMVFNRADHHDVEMSNSASRLSSYDRARTRSTAEGELVEDSDTPRFGPLARSVASGRSDARVEVKART